MEKNEMNRANKATRTIRDAPFDIWGGEVGSKNNWNKQFVATKVRKKVCCKCGQKKKFVVEIDEKYVDQKNHQMLAYIIGKAYDKKKTFHFFDKT